MKNTNFLIYCLITILTAASGQIYKEYFGDSIDFSSNYVIQYTGVTLSVSNASSLYNPVQNYTANSTIDFAVILSNEQIIFLTDTTIYILDPVTMRIQNQQAFLNDRAYLIPLSQDNRLIFAMYQSPSIPLYYLDPTQDGDLTLIDEQYNTYQTFVSILGDGTILVADPWSFEVIATNGTTLFSVNNLSLEDGVVSTDYDIFALGSDLFLQVFDLTSYNSINLTFSSMINYDLTSMPTPSRFLVFTQDYKISIYSYDSTLFPDSFPNAGNITLNSSTAMMLYTYLNDGLLAVPCYNSTILLYNISQDSNFFYANISAPNLNDSGEVSIMYLQDTLFAVLSQQIVCIFDYNTSILIKTISLASLGSNIFTNGILQYVEGSLFIAYLDAMFEQYYLITCHYSCASCSNLGPNSCTSCSSARSLQSNSSCTCQSTSDTCPSDQNPCFVCGDNYEVDLSSLSSDSSSSSSSGNSPSTVFNNSGFGGGGSGSSVTNQDSQGSQSVQNITTQGTGQDTTYINYIEALNSGKYATIQSIEVYMQSQNSIAYMLKVEGINSDGKDSCSYIIQNTSTAATTSFSGNPIYYSSMAISAYQWGSGPNYILDLIGLRGTTQYSIKICVDLENVDSSQTLSFTTKDNNYKVVKYQISLNQAITQSLTQDLLCFLTTYTSIPSSRIYAYDGTQCNQIFFGMQSSPEIFENSHNNNLRILDTSNTANSVNVLFYGNPNTETNDTSVDQAVYLLNTTGNNGLVFKDSYGNPIDINSMTYLGLAGLGTPSLEDNVNIDTTSDSVEISNIVVSGTNGYIYAMLSTDTSNLTLPTQDEINSIAIAGNNSGSASSNGYFWHFNSDTPVSIFFQGLSKGQSCTVYYYASNEDVTNFAKYTDVYSKTVQTANPMSPALLIMIIVLSVALFILCAIVIMCCAIKRRAFVRRNAYRSNNIIEIKKPVRITQQIPPVDIRLEELKQEKEGLNRILFDLEKANNTSLINMSNLNDVNTSQAKDFITPSDLDQFKRKIKAIESKIDNFEQEKLCPICYEHPKDLLLGCGHLICSEKCGSVLEECPFDKTIIRTKKRIFQV